MKSSTGARYIVVLLAITTLLVSCSSGSPGNSSFKSELETIALKAPLPSYAYYNPTTGAKNRITKVSISITFDSGSGTPYAYVTTLVPSSMSLVPSIPIKLTLGWSSSAYGQGFSITPSMLQYPQGFVWEAVGG